MGGNATPVEPFRCVIPQTNLFWDGIGSVKFLSKRTKKKKKKNEFAVSSGPGPRGLFLGGGREPGADSFHFCFGGRP